jgi:hypothetical protein
MLLPGARASNHQDMLNIRITQALQQHALAHHPARAKDHDIHMLPPDAYRPSI